MANQTQLPTLARCLVLTKTKDTPENETSIKEKPLPALTPGHVLLRVIAAGFNHRELWQKKKSYPGITDGSTLGCDGAGIVIASGDGEKDPLLNNRVFINPTRGWISDPTGPEGKFGTVGGGAFPDFGTMTDYVVVERDELIEIPEHLSFEQAAAWPCAGVTAWRAVFVKGGLKPGQNVLITGIGGGVALTCLQMCVAAGANVYVTSSDPAKIGDAVNALRAKGGVNYKQDDWPEELSKLLKSHTDLDALLQGSERRAPLLDLVIDQGGGDICNKVARIIKNGGIISCFGMHAGQGITFPMTMVLKNVELKGSTLGSRNEMVEATQFIAKHKIVPIVSTTLNGLDSSLQGFELLREGKQMGKVVVSIAPAEGSRL